jgi:hypothetical protein
MQGSDGPGKGAPVMQGSDGPGKGAAQPGQAGREKDAGSGQAKATAAARP